MKKIKLLFIMFLTLFIFQISAKAIDDIDWTLDESLNLKPINAVFKKKIDIDTGGLQGFTLTDKYIVFAHWTGNDKNTTIYILDKNTFEVLNTVSDYSFGHANDMAYNSKTGEIIISNTSDTSRYRVTKFKINDSYQIVDMVDSPVFNFRPNSIAYDPDDNYYIIYGSQNIVHILNSEFQEIRNFKAPTYLSGQGLSYLNGHIFFCAYEAGYDQSNRPVIYQPERYNSKEKASNVVYVYDILGTLDKTLYISHNTVNGEVESISFYDDSRILFGYNIVENDSRNISFYISDSLKQIENIVLLELPSKNKYKQNEEFDLSGAKVTIEYANYTSNTIDLNSSNTTIEGFDSSKVGYQTVKLKYNGYEFPVNIEITKKEQIVEVPDTLMGIGLVGIFGIITIIIGGIIILKNRLNNTI